MATDSYQAGYEAAYTEIYAALESEDHPRNCGDCRACGVMRSVIEDAMLTLSRKLSTEEFFSLASIFAQVNAREEPGRFLDGTDNDELLRK